MLGKIKLIFWLFAILIVAYFVSMNSEPKISITLFPNIQTKPMPLSLIIVGSIIIGTVLILIIAISDWILFKIEKAKLNTKIKSLQKELDELNRKLDDCNRVLKECENKKNLLSEKIKTNQNEENQK